MTRPESRWLLVASTLLLAGCPAPITPAGLDAGTLSLDATATDADLPPAQPDAAPVSLDAGRELRELTIDVRTIADDAGIPLKASAEEVRTGATFELEMPALADVRVRLFDEDDRAVPSTDHLELGQVTRYRLVPSEALVAGSRYKLVVDGLRSDYPTDPAGRGFAIAHIELRTAGEKPVPTGARNTAKQKRKSGKKKH